jgi:hypothetical protein
MKDTKRTATLLAEAMDRFQALFIDTAGSRLRSGPLISYEEWNGRKHEAIARRQSAGDIADVLEARVPASIMDAPKFRRSSDYLFYVASRRGLWRQFSAADITQVANDLLWLAEYEDDVDLATETGERANELGQHALFLLEAAPTLKADAPSFQRMKSLWDSLEESYEEAKASKERAIAAINRLNPPEPAET